MNKIFLARIAALALLFAATTTRAQTFRSFAPRFSDNVRGGMTFVSNSIVTSAGTGTPDYTALPPGCGAATGNNCRNDEFGGRAIDIDGNPATHNSSSADLALPACNTVVFAGLYWAAGATIANNPANPISRVGNGVVKFKVPGASAYQTINATKLDTFYNIFQAYQAYADVTPLVQAAGAGTYTVADVACDTTRRNTHAGWTMVVVFRDSTQPTRNITVFDGVVLVNGSTVNTATINLTGFHAPPTGAVAARIGVVCYDGDRGPTDSFSIQRNDNGTFVSQSAAGEGAAATSSVNDAWNSSITRDGSNVTTRNPAYANTYGYDADIFALSNTGKTYIRNNDSSLVMRIGTQSEGYILNVVATQVDVYAPELLLEGSATDVNGGTYALGDTLLVNLSIRNTGTDTAVNARIVETLPAAFEYVPGSLVVDGVARTDAAADDAAEYNAASKTITLRVGNGATATTGGTIRSNGTDVFSVAYRIIIDTNCADVGATPATLSRQASVRFSGLVDTDPDTVGARPMPVNGCTQGPAPAVVTVPTGCLPLSAGPQLLLEGEQTPGGAQLRWWCRGDACAGAAGYTVWASAYGREFLPVSELPAAAAAFTDDAPRRYYRVSLRTAAGTVVSSRVLALDAAHLTTSVSIHPNPSRGPLTLAGLPPAAVVDVLETAGRTVLRAAGPVGGGSLTLEGVSALPPGVYLVRVAAPGAPGSTLRWIKQ